MTDFDALSTLDRRPPPRVAVVPLYVVALLMALGLVAAMVVEVDETVLARGVLIPPGDTARLMTETGGRVEQISVAEGQPVAPGQVVLRFEAAEAARMVAALEAQVVAARDEVESLTARAQAQADLAALEVARARDAHAGREAELGGLQEAARLARAEAELVDRRRDRSRVLVGSGDTSQERLEESLREGTAARADLARVRAEVAGRRKDLEGLEKVEQQAAVTGRLAALDAQVQLIGARANLADVLRRLADAQQGVERAVVRAPIAGTLHVLTTRVGEVVPPGAVIARIVPQGGELEAEVEVPASEMASVRQGQTARLSLDAFPFADHGDVAARVIYVAPDATPAGAEGRLPSFRVRLRLERTDAWLQRPLGPGMPLTARMLGRRETLGWWLLRPLRSVSRRLDAP